MKKNIDNLWLRCMILIVCVALYACKDDDIIASGSEGWNGVEENVALQSPNGNLKVDISVGKYIKYILYSNGEQMVDEASLSMSRTDRVVWGYNSTLMDVQKNSVNEVIKAPFYTKNEVSDVYNEVVFIFKENFKIVFRAYDEGMAYRFISTETDEFQVKSEKFNIRFPDNPSILAGFTFWSGTNDRGSMEKNAAYCSFESYYFDTFQQNRAALTPMLIRGRGGKSICIMEADVHGYPAMFIQNGGTNTLSGYMTPCVSLTSVGGSSGREYVPTGWHSYIADCKGAMNFPWRIISVADRDIDLLNNDMVYRLASASSGSMSFSWVKPGHSTWDYATAYTLDGVDFVSGLNTKTYKYHIDFAKRMGIEYVQIDAGGIERGLGGYHSALNMPELVEYARTNGVGILMWTEAAEFKSKLMISAAAFEAAFKKFHDDGLSGLKVDFFDRNDQEYIDLQWRIAEMAAKYKLVINFHGSPTPNGLNRTYPNVLSFEAIMGLEQMKWSEPTGKNGGNDQVVYDLTFPFLRGIAGPADYTPGLMRNVTRENFKWNGNRPMSLGTRCRQLATYILFYSPLGMLADNITTYEKEQECVEFISSIPTVWDASYPLDGKMKEYVAIARKKGNQYFVGAMNDWMSERKLTLNLSSFLGAGRYKAEIFRDGDDSNTIPTQYVREIINIPENGQLSIMMKSGGGFAARIYAID